ncbi:MAG: hypothetical protein CMI09_05595 [Oceanospirillaceae bacterium]|nr:hypothetical protein [Oceanospirillaceae bacterium]
MYKQVVGSLAGIALAVSLAGCSNGSSSSNPSTVNVEVQIGQEDARDASVWSIGITNGGQPNRNDLDRFIRSEVELDDNDNAEATVVASTERPHMFMLVPRVAQPEINEEATTRLCQWVSGCTVDGTSVAFAERYEQQSGWHWQSVAHDVASGERIRVTPLTHLAAQLAYERQYVESTTSWDVTGYYSGYSVEQSISQVSRLFGINNIQGSEPQDLTLIDRTGGGQATAMDRIRYGALLAAWQNLQLAYDGDFDSLADAVAADLVNNDGQLIQKGGTQALALATLFQAARDNLAALSVENTTIKMYVDGVVSDFDSEIAALVDDTLTSVTPAPLAELFSSSDLEDYELGLKRTKAFVEVLRNYEDTFFEDGYRDELNAYLDRVKAAGDNYEADLNKVVDAFIDTHELYTRCFLDAGCPTNVDAYSEWLTQIDSYNTNTAVLTLNNGAITVSQEVADVNKTDSDDDPTESNAIDIKITGTYTSGDLTFKVNHTFVNDDEDEDITETAGVRVYFTTPVSQLADNATNEILGYELRWPDFQMYDANNLSTADELEFDGEFNLFFRGVRDPQDDSSELRFNIDTVTLDSRVSDQVSDDNDDDSDYNSLDIVASSAFADAFYPNKRFASFNGFFETNTSDSFAKGSTATNLVGYVTGTETVNGQVVQYLDVRVPLGDSYRYRVYPTEQRVDDSDTDSDGDDEEILTIHDTETCELTGNDSDGWSVSTCEPQVRLLGESDFTDYINALWRAGTLSRIEIPGRGFYFVEWPATADDQGCYALDTLPDQLSALDGELYLPYVLGLNSLRFMTEIIIDGQPDTLLDARLIAPTTEGYEVTAALSHDYSSTSSSFPITGGGNSEDTITLNYAANADLVTTGSLVVFKDGVSLTLDENETETVDSELELHLRESTNADPLPYRFIINEDGNYERCVTANVAEWDQERNLDTAVLHLNFRDVVYGRIQKEKGQWIIRYIDGIWETL